MYSVLIQQVNSDTQTEIHSPFVGDLKLSDAQIVKSVGDIETFSFDIYPSNKGFHLLHPFTTLVEVWNTKLNKLLFKGRVLKPDEKMDGAGLLSKTIVCEGELAFLHDSYQQYGRWQNLTPKQFFTELIHVHNAQVEEYKRFEIGNIDVTNSTDNVYRYTADDVSTFDTIQDKLIDRLGGELAVRYEDGVRYIDYVLQSGQKGNQSIELSKNLLSQSKSVDPSEIITVLKPLGETLENDDDNTDASAPRLTIESVNDGSPYLRDESLINLFGIQTGVEIWNDVTLPTNLKSKGLDFLAKQKVANVRYQIDAVDLSSLELSVDEFMCGWTYDVYNPIMQIDEEVRVIGLTIDINDVTSSNLKIGDKFLSEEQYKREIARQISKNNEISKVVDAQGRSISSIRVALEQTEENLILLQQTVESGNGDVQNQISSILDEMQLLVNEMQNIALTIPSEQTMTEITTMISDLNDFKSLQIITNANFEQRISELETNTEEPGDDESGGI